MRAVRIPLISALLAAVLLALPSHAQPDPAKMRSYVLGLLFKGPAWTEAADTARHAMAFRLFADQSVAGAGPVVNDDRLMGVVIFDCDSVAIAERRLAAEPAMQAGVYHMEMHPWYSIKGIGAGFAAAREAHPDSMPPMESYQFGLIRRGTAWSPEQTPERERLQAGHMANIERLAAEGKLVMAGPMMDDGVLRGIFVYHVASRAEADTLVTTDPAVAAGRLAVDLYDLKMPAGIVPQSGKK
jgi:uncharacterized protein YciI